MKNLMKRILAFVVLVAIVFGLSPAVPAKAEESIDVTKEIEVQDYVYNTQDYKSWINENHKTEIQDPFIGTITYKFHLDDLSFLSVNFAPSWDYEDYVVLKLYDSNNKLLLKYADDQNCVIVSPYNGKLLLPSGDYYIKVKNDRIRENVYDKSGAPCYTLNLIECKIKNIDDLMFEKNKGKTYSVNRNNLAKIIASYYLEAMMSVDSYNLVYGETYGFTTTVIRAINPYNIKELSFSFNIKNYKSKAKITFSKEIQAIRDGKSPSEVYSSTSSTSSTTKKTDTKKPTVKGVKNGKTYKKKVKFTVYDKSGIKKVTLNGKKISVKKAKKGYTVKKAKNYTLKVWDKKGNKRTVKFRIK